GRGHVAREKGVVIQEQSVFHASSLGRRRSFGRKGRINNREQRRTRENREKNEEVRSLKRQGGIGLFKAANTLVDKNCTRGHHRWPTVHRDPVRVKSNKFL